MASIRAKDPHAAEKNRVQTAKWRKKNPEALARNQAKYRQKHRVELASYYKKWREKNWGVYLAYQASRKKRVRIATPPWANKKDIVAFYRNRPDGHHVDHIVPINGKNVCGLHVPWNLQYLPVLENLKKSNRLME